MLIRKNNNLILAEGSTQGLDGATLTAEKMHSVSFTENILKSFFKHSK